MQSPPHNHSQLPGASSRDAAEWFFHHSDEGFALARDGRLVSVNPAWCAITRSRPLVEVGRPLSELFLPSDEHRYLHVLGRLEADGVAEVEHRLPCTLGGYVWVRMSIKRGEGDYAILILQDISARMAGRMRDWRPGEASNCCARPPGSACGASIRPQAHSPTIPTSSG